MKTILPGSITSEAGAKSFMSELHSNNELFHLEDNAHDVVWSTETEPTDDEKDQLNTLMDQVMSIPGFDPFDFALKLVM